MSIGIPEDIYKAMFEEAADDMIGKKLHERSGELAQFELSNIRRRTPRRTGALWDSAGAKPHKEPSNRSLATLYYEDEPQLFEWQRVYSIYQEGPPLGIETY